MVPVALTIAGSDPSGGAGIQADLKTFHQSGVYGEAVITLITVQNTAGVGRVECLDPRLVWEQIEAVFDDIPPGAVKTGALGTRAIVEAVAAAAREWKCPLVVDPVMISKHDARLLPPDAAETLRLSLLPLAALITPNLEEARALAGIGVNDLEQMREAARRIAGMGAHAVLIKGGHLKGDAADLLFADGEFHCFTAPRVHTPHTHGTGCTYSAAITALLARGVALPEAVGRAKAFIDEAIRTNPGLGRGCGPVNHHATSGLGAGEAGA
jgi:hydroxymethylpyrimidine/phosphomethylpyrimidine kinase